MNGRSCWLLVKLGVQNDSFYWARSILHQFPLECSRLVLPYSDDYDAIDDDDLMCEKKMMAMVMIAFIQRLFSQPPMPQAGTIICLTFAKIYSTSSSSSSSVSFSSLSLGMPPFQKSAVFLNIVQKAFDPPPLLFEHLSYFAGGVF